MYVAYAKQTITVIRISQIGNDTTHDIHMRTCIQSGTNNKGQTQDI